MVASGRVSIRPVTAIRWARNPARRTNAPARRQPDRGDENHLPAVKSTAPPSRARSSVTHGSKAGRRICHGEFSISTLPAPDLAGQRKFDYLAEQLKPLRSSKRSNQTKSRASLPRPCPTATLRTWLAGARLANREITNGKRCCTSRTRLRGLRSLIGKLCFHFKSDAHRFTRRINRDVGPAHRVARSDGVHHLHLVRQTQRQPA
jgi:hypothetical protein